MKTINARTAPTMKNPHGVRAAKLYETEAAQAVHIELEPGQSLKRHATPTDVFFYVLEGTGVVEVGEDRAEVGADTLVESPSGIPHCWHNEGSEPLRVLVVKAPRQSEPTRMLE